MIGGIKSPFRLPCDSVAPRSFLACKANHQHAAPVDAFGNTTTMLDHCGNTAPADKRFTQLNTCGNDICAPDCDDCPGGTNLITNTPAPPAIADNTWSAATGTVQLEPTEKIGGKWIQAFKNWHGRWAFDVDANGADCGTGALSNTRYRTMRVQASALTDDQSAPGTDVRSFDLDFTITISQLSGVASLVSFSYSETSPTPMSYLGYIELSSGSPSITPTGFWDYPSGASLPYLLSYMIGMSCCHAHDTDWNYNYPGGTFAGDDQDYVSVFTASATSIHRVINNTVHDGINTSVNLDVQITLSDAYTINDVKSDAETQAAEWVLTKDLECLFRTDGHTTVAPIVIRNEQGGNVSPSAVFTVGYAGAHPDQVDDLTQPIDDGGGNSPFTMSWAPTYVKRTWFDPNAYRWTFAPGTDQTNAAATGLELLLDGALIGSPLAAGYGQPVDGNPRGVFDRDHVNWFRRNCDPGVGWTQSNESLGAFTPDYLPANAQLWTNDFTATTLWPCAFINADVTGVYLQKWCEVKLKRPSINFARPFGPDKFVLDEAISYVFYVDDFTAGVVTLKNIDFSTPGSVPFTTSDIVGSSAVGGFFAVTSVSGNTVTLGTQVYVLPTGWDTPSRDGSACFGRLKYPDAPGTDFIDTRPEIGGRIPITVTNGTPVNITTGTVQKYLSLGVNPETVDFLAADNTVLASSVDLTRVDDTHFTVTTDFATIAIAAWIVPSFLNDNSTSGQKYKFADNRPKGDYVYRTWLIKIAYSSVLATSQTDACLQYQPCAPSVAGITPNGETETGDHFFAFPATINNGELWLGQIQFWMQDPFWQQPHTPVAVNPALGTFTPGTDIIIWTEDDGSCHEDTSEVGGGGENIFHLFYPMRPFVEARCTLPTNIDGETPPALASGADLTAVQNPPNQAGIGDAEGPLVDAIVLQTTAWARMLAQRGCVDGAGVFASDYENNGTTA